MLNPRDPKESLLATVDQRLSVLISDVKSYTLERGVSPWEVESIRAKVSGYPGFVVCSNRLDVVGLDSAVYSRIFTGADAQFDQRANVYVFPTEKVGFINISIYTTLFSVVYRDEIEP